MRALIALGGSAPLRSGGPTETEARQDDVAKMTESLAAVAAEHEVVIAHASGPGVGLELALRNALPDRDLVTVPIDVLVDAGSLVSGRGSPPLAPWAIFELGSLRTLIGAGALVVCAGGGVPVTLDGDGTMHRVEGAVDEDLTAALLARRLDADVLVMLADAATMHLGEGGDGELAPGETTPAELRERRFASGSIGPKVEAACRFVEATGRRAAIGELTQAAEIVRGASGTQIHAPGA